MSAEPLPYLVVEDDEAFGERLERALIRRGCTVNRAVSFASASEYLERARQPHRIVLDLRIKSSSGLDLIPIALGHNPAHRIVVLTGFGSIATTQEAIRRGAHSYLTKPCDPERIVREFDDKPERLEEIPIPTLEQVEWEHIQRVIADCGGNITKAAEILGIHRRSLQRRLAKWPKLA